MKQIKTETGKKGLGQSVKIVILAAIMVVTVACGAACSANAVDLDQYVTITTSGYDTQGTAYATFDEDAFIRDYQGKLKLTDAGKSYMLWVGYDSDAELLADLVRGGLDKTSGLSNGDIVTVTLSTSAAQRVAEDYGVSPAKFSKKYCVEGLGHYVERLDDISSEGLAQMMATAESVYDERAASIEPAKNGRATAGTLDMLGCYLLTSKEGTDTTEHNEIYLVYKAQKTFLDVGEDGRETDLVVPYYWYICFHDAVVSDDGTFSVDLSDHDIPFNTYSGEGTFTFEERYFSDSGDLKTTVVTMEGYQDLGEMFDALVTSRSEGYDYESSVGPHINLPLVTV